MNPGIICFKSPLTLVTMLLSDAGRPLFSLSSSAESTSEVIVSPGSSFNNTVRIRIRLGLNAFPSV